MSSNILQDGIFVTPEKTIGNSLSLVFLKLQPNATSADVHKFLKELWIMLKELKDGEVRELKGDKPVHKYSDNLSVLLAFGPRIFDITCLHKNQKNTGNRPRERPSPLSKQWMFQNPYVDGGGTILSGSGLCYSQEITENHAATDEIVLQLISDSQFGSYRATVEIAKLLWQFPKSDMGIARVNGTYSGYLRPDKRGWLGFHEGLSNLKSKERIETVAIKERYLETRQDYWTVGGTYMAFLRMNVDLKAWQTVPKNQQEILVGRDKLTGCPLIGIDRNMLPIKDSRCPTPGTLEVIDERNKYFRELPDYGNQRLPVGISDKPLQYSHIGRARQQRNVPPLLADSLRIYRQGFEFLELLDKDPFFRTGLNFISFQDHPSRIINLLTSPHWLGGTSFASDPQYPLESIKNFVTVRAAGLFYVPPINSNESFPGESIFR